MAGKLRPRCFFDVEIDGEQVGRLVFELFNETTPKTCENFRALCTGERGNSATSGRPLHYKGAPFHRIVKGFMIQGGDFMNGNGTGGESIYGGTFPDENFIMKHEKEMMLSMANRGKDTNGSQFFITTQPTSHLDGVHVAFGRVLSGVEIVRQIESTSVDDSSRPKVDIVIGNCGELVPQVRLKAKSKKAKAASSEDSETSTDSEEDSDTSSESDSSEEERRRKKRKKKQKKKDSKRKKKDKKKKAASEPETEKKEEFFSTVRPDEVPVIPPNKFLQRGGPVEEEKEKVSEPAPPRRAHMSRTYISRSGRKIKGRGTIRYCSRSRSRSRSLTPPHWRREMSRVQPLQAHARMSQDTRWRKGDRLQEQRQAEESGDEEQKSSRKKKKVPTATLR